MKLDGWILAALWLGGILNLTWPMHHWPWFVLVVPALVGVALCIWIILTVRDAAQYIHRRGALLYLMAGLVLITYCVFLAPDAPIPHALGWMFAIELPLVVGMIVLMVYPDKSNSPK
jgi:hypothetical protein